MEASEASAAGGASGAAVPEATAQAVTTSAPEAAAPAVTPLATAAPSAAAATEAPSATAGSKAPSAITTGELPSAPLVLYDGNCGLCAKSVRWILDHERDHTIVFAPLQGTIAQIARERYPHIPASIDTVVYISDGRAHLRSKAFLHAANHLRAPWHWGYAMRWFPGFVLDVAYRMVAGLRYRIWGYADACGLVTPEQRRRFLP